jgi:type VI secretion system ImpC/EvpB family protein
MASHYQGQPGPAAAVLLQSEPSAAAVCEPVSLLDLACRPVGKAAPPSGPDVAELSAEAAVRYYQDRTSKQPAGKDDLIGLLSRDVAEIDALLTRQVNAILHHPSFQRLEAAWRGLQYLVESALDGEGIRIVVLHLPKRELADDLHGALEFDQSEFFRKVYEEEYDMPGGEPFGLIVADYEFRNSPSDVGLLGKISQVAAAAFAPCIGGADPALFGIPNFGLLERVRDLGAPFGTLQFLKWNSLRESEDARFLGLAMPHVLMRLPYRRHCLREDGFIFEEETSAGDCSGYLWANAAFAFGAVVIRAFSRSGWFADIRGTSQGPGSGGVVTGLPAPSFCSDRPGVALKSSVEVNIGEAREKELSDLGFVALCDCEDTPYAAFFANQSLQKPKVYDDELATTNARLSAMLQYILCASRFAHYVKIMARDMTGSITDPKTLQSRLHTWIHQFVAQDPGNSAELRARFPLQEARIEVHDHPRDPGHFLAELCFSPHCQLDELTASVKLVAGLPKQ